MRNLLFLGGHVHVHISLTGGIFFGATLTCNFYSRVCTFCFFVVFVFFWGGTPDIRQNTRLLQERKWKTLSLLSLLNLFVLFFAGRFNVRF